MKTARTPELERETRELVARHGGYEAASRASGIPHQTLRGRANDAGLCANCRKPKLSEWYCWECLNRMQFGRLERRAEELGGLDVSID